MLARFRSFTPALNGCEILSKHYSLLSILTDDDKQPSHYNNIKTENDLQVKMVFILIFEKNLLKLY